MIDGGKHCLVNFDNSTLEKLGYIQGELHLIYIVDLNIDVSTGGEEKTSAAEFDSCIQMILALATTTVTL